MTDTGYASWRSVVWGRVAGGGSAALPAQRGPLRACRGHLVASGGGDGPGDGLLARPPLTAPSHGGGARRHPCPIPRGHHGVRAPRRALIGCAVDAVRAGEPRARRPPTCCCGRRAGRPPGTGRTAPCPRPTPHDCAPNVRRPAGRGAVERVEPHLSRYGDDRWVGGAG
ncbi:hypothetical protein LT493_16740 [Streptomyces tricolor]|nr:hypothetical protein [Streptomyces tricolor]